MTKNYLAILTKHELFSFLGIVEAEVLHEDAEAEAVTAVIKLDPREGEPRIKQFATRSEAIRAYEEAIATSLDRDWRVVYRGTPISG